MFKSGSKSSSKYSFNSIISSFITNTKSKSNTLKPLAEKSTDPSQPSLQVLSDQSDKFIKTPDHFKFNAKFASYVHHGSSWKPIITSLMDLTDLSSNISLLPRRRLYGNPYETLSIKSGDDAMIISPNMLGVADGVSGWSGEHANSGLFARSFLENISRNFTDLSYKNYNTLEEISQGKLSEELDTSYLESLRVMQNEEFHGSSTLLVAMIIDERLQIMNIGDSKIFIIRDGQIVSTNKEQYISNLCPQQIGTATQSKLPSSVVQNLTFDLEDQDILLLCTDGVTDNLYQDEILDVINAKLNQEKTNLQDVANTLLYRTKSTAFDNDCASPYVEKVNSIGNQFISGGKLDDISVCIAKVVINS